MLEELMSKLDEQGLELTIDQNGAKVNFVIESVTSKSVREIVLLECYLNEVDESIKLLLELNKVFNYSIHLYLSSIEELKNTLGKGKINE